MQDGHTTTTPRPWTGDVGRAGRQRWIRLRAGAAAVWAAEWVHVLGRRQRKPPRRSERERSRRTARGLGPAARAAAGAPERGGADLVPRRIDVLFDWRRIAEINASRRAARTASCSPATPTPGSPSPLPSRMRSRFRPLCPP
jgi:hypothetical protein